MSPPPLPLWFQIAQGSLTLLIAAVVCVIAYRQWRTARENTVLSLFEKRWETYAGFRAIIGEVLRSGQAPFDVSIRYLRAIDRAEFLFGDEVNAFLKETYKRLVDLDYQNTMMRNPGPDHATHVQNRHDNFMALSKFYETIDRLVKPYMHMTQRLPSW